MKFIYSFTTLLLLATLTEAVYAKSVVAINPVGASSKGQYVAFEEFGYLKENQAPYAKIRIMNAWKNKYVGKTFLVKSHDKSEKSLEDVRKEAMARAKAYFRRYHIR